MATNKLLLALVLVDVAAHGLKAGQLLEASPALVAGLKKDGSVDDHKDAVQHAQSERRAVVRSSIETAAAAKAKAEQDLRVEVAQLTELHGKAADGPDKDALAAQLATQKSALEQLAA